MNSNFQTRSTSSAPSPIFALAYNENIGEIVTIGPGFIAVSFVLDIFFAIVVK